MSTKIRNRVSLMIGLFIIIIYTQACTTTAVLYSAKKTISNTNDEQPMWWEDNVIPFLSAYYSFDYNTSWELGKEAFENPPYNYTDKKMYINFENRRRNGLKDGIEIISRELVDARLLRVETYKDGDWYYTLATYKAVYRAISVSKVSIRQYYSNSATCKRMEWILFRRGDVGFDRIATTDTVSAGCVEGAPVGNEIDRPKGQGEHFEQR